MKRQAAFAVVMAVCVGGMARSGMGEATTRPAAASGVLSTDEVKKLMEAGQYSDALKGIIRILALQGAAAAPYNRHEMLMLKAECQIQLRQYPGAVGSAQLAKKEAEQAHHDEDAKESDALLLLLQRSQNGAYVPTTASVKTPIKLAEKEKREEAYKALYEDVKVLFGRKVEAAEKGTGLPPYLELSKLGPTVRTAEYGATKGTAETDATIKDVAEHAAKLVEATLTDLDTKTERISEEANRIVTQQANLSGRTGGTYTTQISHRQGLTGTDQHDLEEMDGTCKRIPPVMADFAKGFPDQADDFKKLASKAQDVSAKVEKTLHADYTTM
jgi:hypothetical protein